MVAAMSAFTLAVFHQHRYEPTIWLCHVILILFSFRFIVLRRIFFLGGLHYFYRAITMYFTVLPKADPNYKCAKKMDEITFIDILRR